MIIYIILVIQIIFLSLVKSLKKQSLICSIFMIGILSLRDIRVGKDLENYLEVFFNFSNLEIEKLMKISMEKGYLILNKIIYFISSNERMFIFIISFILIVLLKKWIDNDSKIVWLSYFIFVTFGYYFPFFNIIRQTLAMLILLLSLKSIKKRNFFHFFIYYLIAINFHYTALFFILLYFIFPIKINLKYYFYIMVLSLSNIIIGFKVIEFIIGIIPKYTVRYKEKIIFGQGLKLWIFLFLIFTIVFFIYLKKKNERNIECLQVYIHMLGIAVFLQGLAYNFSLFARIVNYFSIALVMLIPNLIFSTKNKNLRKIIIFIVCLFGGAYFAIILRENLDGVVPYILNKNI